MLPCLPITYSIIRLILSLSVTSPSNSSIPPPASVAFCFILSSIASLVPLLTTTTFLLSSTLSHSTSFLPIPPVPPIITYAPWLLPALASPLSAAAAAPASSLPPALCSCCCCCSSLIGSYLFSHLCLPLIATSCSSP